jgi:DNA polymerase-3 subunit gamma/tau
MVSSSSTGPRSLYLKWRPEKFGDVVGQEGTVRILRNSAQEGETSHAYLFAGPRGTGKTSVARILAKALNCEDTEDGEPCNTCSSCKKIDKGQALDIVEIDGASNRGIDKIRELREEVNFAPAELRNKVYIIDEVHMLTNQAFNALLKTIEEPPDKVTFIFATTEPEEVPATIISRCQVFEFKEISGEEIKERLAKVAESEGLEITDEGLGLISSRAQGSMRDALVILEQVMGSGPTGEVDKDDLFELLGLVEGETTERYIDALLANESGKLLDILDDLVSRGRDLELFLEGLLDKLRVRIKETNDGERMQEMVSLSRGLLDTAEDLKRSSHKRVALEVGSLELLGQFKEHKMTTESAQDQALNQPDGAIEREPKGKADEVTPEEKPSEDTEQNSSDEDNNETEKNDGESREKVTVPAGDGEKEGLKNSDAWRKMVREIEEDKISIAAFLEEANPIIRNQDLYIEFSREFSFHKESLESGSNLSYLNSLVDNYFDDIDDLRIIYNEDADPESGNSKTSLLDEKSELVKEKFGGNVVEEGRL